MTNRLSTKEYCKRWLIYLTLSSMVLAFAQPAKLSAQECCKIVEEEDCQRSTTAKIVAGASILALVGGIACLTCCTSHKNHSHSSSKNGSYSYGDSYDSYGHGGDSYNRSWSEYDKSSYEHQGHYHSDYHSSHSHHHDSAFREKVGNEIHPKSDPQFFQRDLEGNMPARIRKLARSKALAESVSITGVFHTHPTHSLSAKGSATALVQLPDGTTQILGTLPFSSTSGASLCCGPFVQKGTYLFRLTVDEGTYLSSYTKVGSIEVNVNGSKVENRDFFAPAQVSGHYEPVPCEYSL